MPRGQLLPVGQQPLARMHAIDLVDHGDHAGVPHRAMRWSASLILIGPLERLDHEQHQIGIAHRGGGGAIHGAVERALLAQVQARGVDEGDLRLGQLQQADHPMARGLRARRDDAELLPDQGIQQRGLADIRAAGQRDKAAAKMLS